MEAHPKDRKDPWRWPVIAAVAGGCAYCVSVLLPLSPDLANLLLGNGRAAAPARALSSLTRHLPFSLGEVLIGAYSVWLLALSLRAALEVRAGDRSIRNVLRGGARRMLRDGGIVVLLFYVLWGFNYARPNLAAQSGWPEWQEPNAAELTALASVAVSNANAAYRTLHGADDAGVPTADPPDWWTLAEAVRAGSRGALELLPQTQTGGREMPAARVKRPWSSGLLARLGLSGVFFPLTAEPHVLQGLPAVSAVQSMAHERAHLWGFANESEASFAGYLSSALAPDPLPRYSAAVFAANHLLAALRRTDRDAYDRLRGEFVPGIVRDLEAVVNFWRPYRGLGQRLGASVNDRYLRANRVAGGVGSYRRVSRLLVEFARQQGTLVPTQVATRF